MTRGPDPAACRLSRQFRGISAALLAAVLSAVMSTADSQPLVASSAIAHDLGHGRDHPRTIMRVSRLTFAGLVVIGVFVTLYLPETISNRMLFAWIALGSAFGPTVFLRRAGVRLKPGGVLASICVGLSLAVALYFLPNTPGDLAERILPFSAALVVRLFAREKLRSQAGETVDPAAQQREAGER